MLRPTGNIVPRKNRVAQAAGTSPFSREVGDVKVPFNVGKTVFRYRAPVPIQIERPVIYVGQIVSPAGIPVEIEAWLDGKYMGSIVLENGTTVFNERLMLQALQLFELKVQAKTSSENPVPAEITDMWIMWS